MANTTLLDVIAPVFLQLLKLWLLLIRCVSHKYTFQGSFWKTVESTHQFVKETTLQLVKRVFGKPKVEPPSGGCASSVAPVDISSSSIDRNIVVINEILDRMNRKYDEQIKSSQEEIEKMLSKRKRDADSDE